MILPKPEFTGVRPESGIGNGTASAISLAEIVPFIDWTPFFHTWELRGVYPKILQHEKHGEEARKLFADAQKLLEEIVAQETDSARARFMDCFRPIAPATTWKFTPMNRAQKF